MKEIFGVGFGLLIVFGIALSAATVGSANHKYLRNGERLKVNAIETTPLPEIDKKQS